MGKQKRHSFCVHGPTVAIDLVKLDLMKLKLKPEYFNLQWGFRKPHIHNIGLI